MTNKKGFPNKDLSSIVVKLIRLMNESESLNMSVKGIYTFWKKHYDISERTIRRVILYKTYKDVE